MSPLSWWLLALLIILVIGIIVLIVILTVRTYHRQVSTGEEELKGKTAIVKETLNPEGMVAYQGDLWKAVSNSGRIDPGQEVVISGVKGLKLFVIKKAKE